MSKEAMKLALEAIEAHNSGDWDTASELFDEAIPALREALAEQPAPPQQEPVALPEKIYEFVPTPEPVKWHHPECEGQCIACLIEQVVQEAYGSQGLGYLQRHLTSPPQRKPLTDEEIESVNVRLAGKRDLARLFARAIEAAHGIKETP